MKRVASDGERGIAEVLSDFFESFDQVGVDIMFDSVKLHGQEYLER